MEPRADQLRSANRALGRRIVVVGSTGAGKTTLARTLAPRLNLPHVELDALYWEPGWVPASAPVFRQRVSDALQDSAWVADGNYHVARDIVWGRADTLIWLDYSLPLVLRRLTSRTVRRLVSRTELWNGNREELRGLFSRDSLFLWALTSYRPRRQDYPWLLRGPEYEHLQVVRLDSPRAMRRWLRDEEAFPSVEPR